MNVEWDIVYVKIGMDNVIQIGEYKLPLPPAAKQQQKNNQTGGINFNVYNFYCYFLAIMLL